MNRSCPSKQRLAFDHAPGRAAAARSPCRWSSCRSPTRPPAPACWPAADAEGDAVDRVERAGDALQQALADREAHRAGPAPRAGQSPLAASTRRRQSAAAQPSRAAPPAPHCAGALRVQQAAHAVAADLLDQRRQRARGRRRSPGRSAARSGSRRTAATAAARCRAIAASAAAALARVGQRAQQQPRVGVLRRAEELVGACATSTICPAYISATCCAMPDTTARSCVISSRPMPCSFCSCLQQVEDLRLDGHVERRGRLVGDQEVGLGRPASSRSSRAASGRRSCGTGTRRCGARARGCRPCRSHSIALARAAAPRSAVWRLDRLDDLLADAHHRVQAGRRLLEDHADAAAAHRAHAATRAGASTSWPSSATAPVGDARRSRAAGASAPARSCSCRSPTRRPARRSRRGGCARLRPSMARTRPASASSATLRSSIFSMVLGASARCCAGRAAGSCGRAGRRRRARRRQTGWPPAPA